MALQKTIFTTLLFSLIASVGFSQSELKSKSDLKQFTIGGFIQPKYFMSSDSNRVPNNGFGIRRFEVKIAANITENISVELTEDFGVMRAGSTGDLRSAFLKYTYNSWLKFQLGHFKKPMLKESFLIGSSELRMIDRGLIDASLSSNLFSDFDMGLMLTGDGKKQDMPFAYWVGVFNGNGKNQASDDNSSKQMVAHIEYSPNHELTFGGDVSTIAFENNVNGSNTPVLLANSNLAPDYKQYRSAFGFNVQWTVQDFNVLAEYYAWENYAKTIGSTPTKKAFNDPLRSVGFYINPIYNIAYQTDFFSKMDMGLKFEYVDLDIRSGQGNDITRALTLGSSFVINDNGSRFQLNLIRTEDESRRFTNRQVVVYEGVAQFTVKF